MRYVFMLFLGGAEMKGACHDGVVLRVALFGDFVFGRTGLLDLNSN